MLGFAPLPQSEDLTPKNTIEYANYLHIKNTPRKTKSMAQTLYKDAGRGSEGPNPFFFFFFAKLMVLALKGARARHVMEMILKCFIQYHANQVLWIEVKNLDMAVPGS